MGGDTWAGLADQFADEAYASVKGLVRTHMLHQQLPEHLPTEIGVLGVPGRADTVEELSELTRSRGQRSVG